MKEPMDLNTWGETMGERMRYVRHDVGARHIPVGRPAWAIVDSDGEVVDLYTREPKRENLMLHDTERIVEGTFTPLTT